MTDTGKIVATVVLSAALMPIASACGGGGGNCGKVAPCGGDVIGNWNVSGACFNSSSLTDNISAGCPGATATIAVSSVSGSVAFNADLTYAATTTASLALRETLPASCVQAAGATNCAALDQMFKELMAMDPTIASAGCTGSGTCICSFVVGPQTSTATGTYTTSGTTLTMLESDGTSDSNEYCLQGSQLHVMSLNMTMPMGAMGQANIDADTVLTRR